MKFFDLYQKSAVFFFSGMAFSAMAILSAMEAITAPRVESCRKYQPVNDCRYGHFEVSLHDITEKNRPLIGIAKTNCITIVGEGTYQRYALHEAMFTSRGSTNYFGYTEVPASQTTVCEIR